ncbi:MAG: hypothetical protein E6H91_09860 [Chloroflexi bacterium]|nr:MAG: hypothetical protein E6H91_09860 [Chloroflexota bacterium]
MASRRRARRACAPRASRKARCRRGARTPARLAPEARPRPPARRARKDGPVRCSALGARPLM